MKKLFLLPLIVSVLFTGTYAQDFLNPINGFSKKKTTYLTLENGDKLEGKIKKIKYSKGLVEELKLEDDEGNKHKLTSADIKSGYFPQTGMDKLLKAMDFATDVKMWEKVGLDPTKLNQGYAYFEQTKVKIKKKEKIMMMQLMNPSFCTKIRVYHDPLAKKTASIGVGALTVAGGDAKSYYLKKGDEVAYKLTKRDYRKEFEEFWKTCDAVTAKFGDKPQWTDLAKHVDEYTKYCDE